MEDGEQGNVVPAEVAEVKKEAAPASGGGGGWGGWGGWGTSALSVFTDLQKAAADVADEISKNAAAAAKGVAELQKSVVEKIELDIKDASLPQEEALPVEEEGKEKEKENVEVDENIPLTPQDKLRRSALEKLEGASKDSFLGQGLKAFDDSVESIASGAFQAFGNAWKGSLTLVQKLEHSAENLAGTIQQGTFTQKAGSFVESSKAFTARGIKVLEHVGKETLDMIAAETGIELEKDPPASEGVDGDEGYNEDVTFDRCFYIYGGPEHLEELESLSNHYTLLCNRARAKLAGEAKVTFDGTLKQLHEMLNLSGESDDGPNKGKNVDAEATGSGDELMSLRDSSISKAAEMAAGFTGALGGLAVNEVVKKTTNRVDAIKAEGVHRLSELCAVCISHLVILAKSVLTTSTEEADKTNRVAKEVEWPQDSLGKAALIRSRARAMAGDIEAVSDSFITGIGDVTAAFQAAIKNEIAVAKEGVEDIREGLLKESSLEDKAQAVCSDIENDGSAAIEKIQDGLKHLVYVVLSTSLGS
ncbi:unnamed protein product [Calypogeia fissa]